MNLRGKEYESGDKSVKRACLQNKINVRGSQSQEKIFFEFLDIAEPHKTNTSPNFLVIWENTLFSPFFFLPKKIWASSLSLATKKCFWVGHPKYTNIVEYTKYTRSPFSVVFLNILDILAPKYTRSPFSVVFLWEIGTFYMCVAFFSPNNETAGISQVSISWFIIFSQSLSYFLWSLIQRQDPTR